MGYPGSMDANISSMEEAGEDREMEDIPWKKATEHVISLIRSAAPSLTGPDPIMDTHDEFLNRIELGSGLSYEIG